MTTATTTTTLYRDGAWIKGHVAGLCVRALVFDEPSTYGIGGTDTDQALPATARISKLWVAITSPKGLIRSVAYDYDRGELLADLLLPGELDTITAAVLAVN